MKCQVDAIQLGGGGGSSRIFPWSPEADVIHGGGGSSTTFPWSPKADAIQWGGGSTRNLSLMGPFYIFSLSKRGARAPWAPPLNRPLA